MGKMGEGEDGGNGKEVKKIKSYSDVMKMKLDKMMANPDKPVNIPNYHKKEKDINKAPEFNHNIMGSSAGAGSGEFHLYRQMRRKEQNRLKILGARQERDELNEAYHQKLEENQKMADERTEKKRKKRQRQKNKKKNGAKKKDTAKEEETTESETKETESADKPAKSKEKKDMTIVFYQ